MLIMGFGSLMVFEHEEIMVTSVGIVMSAGWLLMK
jgi:hypothetical protein